MGMFRWMSKWLAQSNFGGRPGLRVTRVLVLCVGFLRVRLGGKVEIWPLSSPTPCKLPLRHYLLFQPSPALWQSGVAGVAVPNPVKSPTVSAGGMFCRSQGMGVLPAPTWKSGLAVWSTGATREWSASSPCVSWGGHQGRLPDPVWGPSLGWDFCPDPLFSLCE